MTTEKADDFSLFEDELDDGRAIVAGQDQDQDLPVGVAPTGGLSDPVPEEPRVAGGSADVAASDMYSPSPDDVEEEEETVPVRQGKSKKLVALGVGAVVLLLGCAGVVISSVMSGGGTPGGVMRLTPAASPASAPVSALVVEAPLEAPAASDSTPPADGSMAQAASAPADAASAASGVAPGGAITAASPALAAASAAAPACPVSPAAAPAVPVCPGSLKGDQKATVNASAPNQRRTASPPANRGRIIDEPKEDKKTKFKSDATDRDVVNSDQSQLRGITLHHITPSFGEKNLQAWLQKDGRMMTLSEGDVIPGTSVRVRKISNETRSVNTSAGVVVER